MAYSEYFYFFHTERKQIAPMVCRLSGTLHTTACWKKYGNSKFIPHTSIDCPWDLLIDIANAYIHFGVSFVFLFLSVDLVFLC